MQRPHAEARLLQLPRALSRRRSSRVRPGKNACSAPYSWRVNASPCPCRLRRTRSPPGPSSSRYLFDRPGMLVAPHRRAVVVAEQTVALQQVFVIRVDGAADVAAALVHAPVSTSISSPTRPVSSSAVRRSPRARASPCRSTPACSSASSACRTRGSAFRSPPGSTARRSTLRRS